MIEAVTGSHGFLGSRLSEHLEQFEILDRSGYIPPGVDVVYDCAAYGNMVGHGGDPLEIYNANLIRVIKETNQLGEKTKYIYISSSSVMLSVQTPYSLSKKAAEEYLKIQDKKIAIIRPFTITGVGDQSNHLIPTLIRSCLYGEEMPFVSEPHHDFIDIEDMVSAILTVRDRGQFNGEIYQVGRGTSYSNQHILKVVESVTGAHANIKPVKSMRAYDSDIWVSNNERIARLGWSPQKTIEQSIIEMVEHERKNFRNIKE